MGIVIPLFKTKEPELNFDLNEEEKLRVKLIQNSIEALKKEEKIVELEISERCKNEIERLNIIDRKLNSLENEFETICHRSYKKTADRR